MKPHPNSLRQQVYKILEESSRPLKTREIADAMGLTSHDLANTLRNMMHDCSNYPGFYRRWVMDGYCYAMREYELEASHPQHPIMLDLWRGWGGADRLVSGDAEEFFGRLRYEP